MRQPPTFGGQDAGSAWVRGGEPLPWEGSGSNVRSQPSLGFSIPRRALGKHPSEVLTALEESGFQAVVQLENLPGGSTVWLGLRPIGLVGETGRQSYRAGHVGGGLAQPGGIREGLLRESPWLGNKR